MKRRGHNVFALYQRRFAGEFCEDFHALSCSLDDRSTNKYHFERLLLEHGRTTGNVAGDLPSVSVANDGHVHEIQRILLGMLDVFRKENCARAGSEDGAAALGEFYDFVRQAFFLQELQLRRALPAGQNQAVATFEVLGGAHFCCLRAKLLEHCRMRLEISLHRQDSNLHSACSIPRPFPTATYQPRVDSRSFSSNCRTSSPRIASPNSSCASRTAFASSK